MWRRIPWLVVSTGFIGLLSACGGSSGGVSPPPPPPPPVQETRSYELGFTPWPYDATVDAVNFVYSEAAMRGDFIAHHLDGGIPWQEALDGTPYPVDVENELAGRLANTPPGMRSYLALSPLDGGRAGLAEYWGVSTNQPLPAPWVTRSFDDPNVITAFTNFSADLIQRFDPEYFNLGIEVSELAVNDAVAFDQLVVFTTAVVNDLRVQFPSLKLMVSVALKSPGSAEAAIINSQMPQLIQLVDAVGVSVYPYVFFDHADKGDPANLPANWLSQIQTLAGNKEIAIAETGWIAERLTIPFFGVDVDSNADMQAAYLDVLFSAAETLDAQFIVWFALVDFDALWNGVLGQDPVAHIWRDIGLYDENLNPRPALDIWQAKLGQPVE
jgi:hypothetical protein